MRVEANVPRPAIDAISLKSFIEQESVVTEIDRRLGRVIGVSLEKTDEAWIERRAASLNFIGLANLEDLRR